MSEEMRMTHDHEERISELEKNCEVSFAKVENHVERILKVIDIQSQSTEMLTDQLEELNKWKNEFRKVDEISEQYKQRQVAMQDEIAELRNQIQNNSVADLNHYNELKMLYGNLRLWNSSQNNDLQRIEEVLRIIIKDVSYPWFTEYEKKNLLSLLDGKKDSGGEE